MRKEMGKAKNNYAGWGNSESPHAIDTIKGAFAPEFWSEYVCQRKPVLIDDHPTDANWKATERWTVPYLLKYAGDVPVRVEHRDSSCGSYGHDVKVDMTFGEVLTRLSQGDTTLYMTTQPVIAGPDGHPEVMAPPTANLASDFPIEPKILGRLVPQQINIWMGCAPQGSTTGLHHDFHDNLYVLLAGRKRFRLYPPSQIASMYVNGEVSVVHPNGRVVYRSQGDVLPDGSEAKEVEAWRLKNEAEGELAAAEAEVAREEKGAKARLAAAEEHLDEILAATLEDGSFDGFDDFDAMELAGSQPDLGPAPTTAGDPESFSKVDMTLPAAKLRSKFPKFPGAAAAITVDMRPGQSLYLPAGWFHEVTSFSGEEAHAGGGGSSEESSAFHLALNYWTHPPDNLDPGPAGLRKPYTSDYWPTLWRARKERYAREAAARAVVAEGASDEQEDEEEELVGRGRRKRGRGGDGHVCEGSARDASPGTRAHFLRGVKGLYGFGRRQHLHRFVSVKVREGCHHHA